MHVAKYVGNYDANRPTMLEVGSYYQIEYIAQQTLFDEIDVVVYPIKTLQNEYWEGHVLYPTLQDAFDDWDVICDYKEEV